MIVQPDGDHLLLITQPEHAALSGRIMAAWRADGLPTRPTRETVLVATREHDNGWLEVDRHPTVDPTTGHPHHFLTAPGATKRPIWPRGVRRLEHDDPAAAALVAQHAITVHERRPAPAWTAFFATLEAERDRILAAGAYGGRLDSLLADYRFVFLGDLLSLVFCCGWREPFDRAGCRIVLEADRMIVEPDPFEGQTVDLTVAARRIPARRYRSDDELHQVLAATTPVVLQGRVGGGAGGGP